MWNPTTAFPGRYRLAAIISIVVALVFALAVILQSGITARAQSVSPPAIDGAQHPELIPDEEMYALFFLTATVASQNARDVDKARAASFIKSLPLNAQDQTVFSDHAQSYRAEHNQLATLPSTTDPVLMAQRLQQRIDLAGKALKSLRLALTPTGDVKLKDFADGQKRSVKLLPIPAMHPHIARKWFDLLFDPLSIVSVHAQGMTPYASLYTTITVGMRTVFYTHRVRRTPSLDVIVTASAHTHSSHSQAGTRLATRTQADMGKWPRRQHL